MQLFKNTDADFCSLVDYIKTFTEEESDIYNLFQLPPIQRNSVWNVAQIERLWDSILRGFPIGSFLVAPRKKQDVARDIYSGEQRESTNEGFFLLDGQQRTRSLLLGFKPNSNSRLWIDLDPKLDFGNAELNDRKFLLRVVTSYQPWGMSDRVPSEKLNENQKREARIQLGVKEIHYDYQVKIDNGFSEEHSENYSWPVRAELPIPMDALMTLCGGTSGKFNQPEWKQVCDLIPARYHRLKKVPESVTEHFKEIIAALKPIINTASKDQRIRSVVLLYQNRSEHEPNAAIQDAMEVLFRRVNAGGTTLQGEEMAYSLLKSSWDGAYDMVSKIVKDERIGYLLPPTGIVMAATRLARFTESKNDVPNPGIGNFRKWIGEQEKGDSFLKLMKSLLVTDENRTSAFHNTIELFCSTVLYRENDTDDIGIPKKLLLSIKPALYHPVLIWIHINNKEHIEKSRVSILRYLIYSFLTADKYDRVSKIAIEVIKDNNSEFFPDIQIYNKLLDEELAVPLPSPEDFARPFEVPADGFLRHWNELFNISEDPYNSFRNWFWNDSKDMLLWFQRRYTTKWFLGYDPTSDDAFDTPYDWDHIMPKSHLITPGASPETHSKVKELNDKFYWNRALYTNSIGNYRMWPFWGNRSDSNLCHTSKLRMKSANWETDLVAQELDLTSECDFLLASAIPLEDQELWYNAGGDVRNWPQKRRLAWQNAVEKRVYYLYQQMYLTFDFGTWK